MRYGEDMVDVFHAFYKPLEYIIPQRNAEQCYMKVTVLLQIMNYYLVLSTSFDTICNFSYFGDLLTVY